MTGTHNGAVPLTYPLALAITLAIEVPIYTVVLRRVGLTTGWRAAALGVLVNLLTHPVVWLAINGTDSLARFAIGEIVVAVVEAVALWLFVRRDGALLGLTAVVANASSVLAGLVLA